MLDAYWIPVALGGTLAGASSGLVGVYIVGMRIPFLAVCISHAALAGAVFGALGGLTGTWMLVPALAAAVVTALALGMLDEDTIHIDANVLIGIFFSLSMGLAFLGIGLFGVLGRSDNDVRSLLWGSVLLLRWRDVVLISVASGLLAGFVAACRKEMRAIMFSRWHARAAGVPVTFVWSTFLALASLVLTVSFQTVGGLMIYSLVTNPATAAFQITRGHDRALLLAVFLGAVSGLGGFAISYVTNLPTGATIVILSSLLVAVAFVWRRLRGGR